VFCSTFRAANCRKNVLCVAKQIFSSLQNTLNVLECNNELI